MRRCILFSLITFLSGRSIAQSTNISNLFQSTFKKAERMYNQQGYRNAIDLYRIVLDRDPQNRLAKEKVADCYYRMGRYEEAKRWYQRLTEEKNPNPQDYYQLGQVLSILERYDSAKYFFENYARLNGTDKRASLKIDFINNLGFYRRDSISYSISRPWYNSEEADFSPQHFGEGIVFVSSRDRDLFIKRKSLSGINETEGLLNAFYVGPSFDSTKSLNDQVNLFYSKALNSPYHDGPVTFYDNGKRIAFTRNILQNGKPAKDDQGRVNLELYFATLGANRTMMNIERFPFSSLSYSIAHPWVSNDGTELYFASNMPGGYGGADLYVSHYKDDTWTKPENLGDVINTAGDEYSPYLSNNELLFFSSNGFGGFGGLDNFVSRKTADKFRAPLNLGHPINTSMDDFGLIVDPSGKAGFFASNRNGGDDDIYTFVMKRIRLAGHVKEQTSQLPVPQATVIIRGDQNQVIHSLISDEFGNFFVELEIEKEYSLVPQKEGYTALEEQHVSTRKASLLSDTLSVAIWKNGLLAKGVVYSNELQTTLPNTKVYLRNVSTNKTDSVSTTATGAYSFLVLPNNSYHITARHPGYLENGFNLNTHSLFSGNLLNDILLEEKYLEKLTVLFESNKWELRPEFATNVHKIIRSLNRFRDATVYIGAHADSQGAREYNKKLSDKRAQAILAYLKSKNIHVKRIQAFGFGEELILNLCSDGVECTNEEHAQNRRAEIKVQLESSDH